MSTLPRSGSQCTREWFQLQHFSREMLEIPRGRARKALRFMCCINASEMGTWTVDGGGLEWEALSAVAQHEGGWFRKNWGVENRKGELAEVVGIGKRK